jgi:hypothetical protein
MGRLYLTMYNSLEKVWGIPDQSVMTSHGCHISHCTAPVKVIHRNSRFFYRQRSRDIDMLAQSKRDTPTKKKAFCSSHPSRLTEARPKLTCIIKQMI